MKICKVTAFITRQSQVGYELLLFKHPYAGIQIPAGTVEADETPEQAVLREAREETGLESFASCRYLGRAQEELPAGQKIVAQCTKVYARPDVSSFDWAYLRRGIPVTVLRKAPGFCQVTYEEWDQSPNPQYVSMRIMGWAPNHTLVSVKERHFFQLAFDGRTPERWTVHTDNHHFELFWSPLTALPEIIPPQDQWLAFLRKQLYS